LNVEHPKTSESVLAKNRRMINDIYLGEKVEEG
jgi:hypothetical protein